MIKHINITITGSVQDVGFRWAAKEQAAALKITGRAQNLPDGTLYIEAEGEPWQLDKFAEWCGQGPMFARVKGMEQGEGAVVGYKDFEIVT